MYHNFTIIHMIVCTITFHYFDLSEHEFGIFTPLAAHHIASGKKLELVKAVRSLCGCNLHEAKKFAEILMDTAEVAAEVADNNVRLHHREFVDSLEHLR